MFNNLFSKVYFNILPKFFLFRKAGAEKKEWWAYNFLKCKLAWKDLSWDELKPSNVVPNDVVINKTIFVYWKQGFENAPDLVKKCVSSLERFKGDCSIVYLTEKNIGQYISLPEFVIEKHDKGIIKEAFFSDILRINLLYRFGGVWFDATCFLSDSIPGIVKESDFFVFRSVLMRQLTPIVSSSWFMKANAGSVILKKTQNYLFEWIRLNDYIPNYYMLHLVLSLLVNEDEECKVIWQDVPYYNNMSPHTFYFNWSSQYNEEYYDFLMNSCFVHKLSYKFDPNLLQGTSKNMLQHFLEANKSIF